MSSGKGFGKQRGEGGSNDRKSNRSNEAVFVDHRADRSHPMLSGLPPEISQAELSHFITLNWDGLAAFSYQCYLHEGRGMVVLDWDGSLNRKTNYRLYKPNRLDLKSNLFIFPSLYLGERGPLGRPMLLDPGFRSVFERFSLQYVPETMVTFVLVWGVDPVRTDQGNQVPFTVGMPGNSPLDLYKSQFQRQVEFDLGSPIDRLETFDEFLEKYRRWYTANRSVTEPATSIAEQMEFAHKQKALLVATYVYHYRQQQQPGVLIVIRVPDGHWGLEYLRVEDLPYSIDGYDTTGKITEYLSAFKSPEHGFVLVFYFIESGVYRSYPVEMPDGIDHLPSIPDAVAQDLDTMANPSLDVYHFQRVMREMIASNRTPKP